MHSEDRLIHFSTELVHGPVQHSKATLQKLYFDLAQTRTGYDSTDFSTPGQPRFYSRRGERTQSVVVFPPDRIALIEEWADISLSDFLVKIREVLNQAFGTLGIPAFNLQAITLRSTFVLTHFSDARVFLLERVCGQAGRLTPHFKRPIGIGGLRFVLPPVPGFRGNLHVALESFRHTINEVLVEVRAVYNNVLINRDNAKMACRNIEDTRAFITENVFPYLDQYDLPEE